MLSWLRHLQRSSTVDTLTLERHCLPHRAHAASAAYLSAAECCSPLCPGMAINACFLCLTAGPICAQVNDGLLLSGKLREYRAAFSAADLSQNGTIGGQEIERLFKK